MSKISEAIQAFLRELNQYYSKGGGSSQRSHLSQKIADYQYKTDEPEKHNRMGRIVWRCNSLIRGLDKDDYDPTFDIEEMLWQLSLACLDEDGSGKWHVAFGAESGSSLADVCKKHMPIIKKAVEAGCSEEVKSRISELTAAARMQRVLLMYHVWRASADSKSERLNTPNVRGVVTSSFRDYCIVDGSIDLKKLYAVKPNQTKVENSQHMLEILAKLSSGPIEMVGDVTALSDIAGEFICLVQYWATKKNDAFARACSVLVKDFRELLQQTQPDYLKALTAAREEVSSGVRTPSNQDFLKITHWLSPEASPLKPGARRRRSESMSAIAGHAGSGGPLSRLKRSMSTSGGSGAISRLRSWSLGGAAGRGGGAGGSGHSSPPKRRDTSDDGDKSLAGPSKRP